ncbi:MAG: TVP38/TMEM64 family protein [Candidatus Viridilinea halotolerans]|uniref:TVP38/TMEM64 family membrane protein n=1 Tax=Candidatus Viridilinea halotolerans TaxID=2491704 RepID=A0A426TV61_9CHLR|nr:MAG: TVP38/TMEM64 family protein [Candidatus Viridilinea halotolerans]
MLETPTPHPAPQHPNLLVRHWQAFVAALIWLGLGCMVVAYALLTASGPQQVANDVVYLLRGPLGPLFYLIIYSLRPLTFFPAGVLTILGGSLWGTAWGMFFAVLGSNMSASLAYLFGRAFGHGMLPSSAQNGPTARVVKRYTVRLWANAFPTILFMRMIYIPYDIVNYLAGFLRVPFRPFLLATFLGALPGTFSFVLAGAALDIDDILAGNFQASTINPWTLAASVVLLVVGIAVARWLRRYDV